jgi:hypothetical protein
MPSRDSGLSKTTRYDSALALIGKCVFLVGSGITASLDRLIFQIVCLSVKVQVDAMKSKL